MPSPSVLLHNSRYESERIVGSARFNLLLDGHVSESSVEDEHVLALAITRIGRRAAKGKRSVCLAEQYCDLGHVRSSRACSQQPDQVRIIECTILATVEVYDSRSGAVVTC